MAAAIDDTAQTAKLGFDKFTNDMRRIGLINSPQFPDPSAQNIGAFPQQPPSGFGQNVLGSMAPSLAGFDPNRGGMTYQGFKEQAVENSLDPLKNFMTNNAGAVAGTIGGAIYGSGITPGGGSIGGALTGLGIGSTADLVTEI